MDYLTHSRDDIWNRVNDQNAQIADISRGQAATDARLTALEGAVESGFNAISTELRALAVAAQPKAPNYIGWLGALILVLSTFGGYSLLLNQPITDSVGRNHTQIESIADELNVRNRVIGGHETRLEWHQEWLNFIELQLDSERGQTADVRERIAKLEGKLEALEKSIDAIDNGGSRRWNSDSRK